MIDNLSLHDKGSKRRGKNLKKSSGLKVAEGKKPMSFEVHRFLCRKLFESPKREHVFTHLFLVLDWQVQLFVKLVCAYLILLCNNRNLIKRAENAVNAKMDHVYFENDSLLFE